MKILDENNFKTIHNGSETKLITLKNQHETIVQITNFGAKIAAVWLSDRDGQMADVVLGYNSIDEYIKGNPYFGAICGRYANRIANGKFLLDGTEFKLPINNGPNSLHGGISGFNDKVWQIVSYTNSLVELSYLSADGEEGYPGNLRVTVKYELTNDNELKIDYSSITDRPTIINLTNHSFFNLRGEGSGDVLEQELKINASYFTPCNQVQIPTGEIRSVVGTPFNFMELCAIGERINEVDEQLLIGKGYDHNYVLNDYDGSVRLAVIAFDPYSGRGMEVYTDTPGMQLYTGNWLDGSDVGKGHRYEERSAFCLECQGFPDAVNQSDFPNVVLRPGEEYHQTTIHKFFVK